MIKKNILSLYTAVLMLTAMPFAVKAMNVEDFDDLINVARKDAGLPELRVKSTNAASDSEKKQQRLSRELDPTEIEVPCVLDDPETLEEVKKDADERRKKEAEEAKKALPDQSNEDVEAITFDNETTVFTDTDMDKARAEFGDQSADSKTEAVSSDGVTNTELQNQQTELVEPTVSPELKTNTGSSTDAQDKDKENESLVEPATPGNQEPENTGDNKPKNRNYSPLRIGIGLTATACGLGAIIAIGLRITHYLTTTSLVRTQKALEKLIDAAQKNTAGTLAKAAYAKEYKHLLASMPLLTKQEKQHIGRLAAAENPELITYLKEKCLSVLEKRAQGVKKGPNESLFNRLRNGIYADFRALQSKIKA